METYIQVIFFIIKKAIKEDHILFKGIQKNFIEKKERLFVGFGKLLSGLLYRVHNEFKSEIEKMNVEVS